MLIRNISLNSVKYVVSVSSFTARWYSPFSVELNRNKGNNYCKIDKQSSTGNESGKQQHIDGNDMGRGSNERHIDPAS